MVNFTPSGNWRQGLQSRYRTVLFRFKRKILSRILIVRIALGAVFLMVILGAGLLVKEPFLYGLGKIIFVPKIVWYFFAGDTSLLRHSGGRTNILVMGLGGAGHEAPELTDTMLFVSLDHKGERPVIISLPRDIWIPSLQSKLNTAYFYGNQKREGGGLVLAKASVSEILGQPVHYGVAVDFNGFTKIVDLVGGVEVDIERDFDDYKYPIPGRENDLCQGDPQFSCRYEHISFKRGKYVLDGQKALRFVRSRNAQGEEGTDFARSARQQKVLVALRGKLASSEVVINPQKLRVLWDAVQTSIERDIAIEHTAILGRLVWRMDQLRIKTVVLDGGTPGDAQTGLLTHPPVTAQYNNQWVLVPRNQTLTEIHMWVASILNLSN